MPDAFVSCVGQTPLIEHEEVGSTNSEAMRLAMSGEAGPIWITSRKQSAGRGRQGRAWESLEGNLHASLLLTLWCRAEELPRLSIVAGVALGEAVAAAGSEGQSRREEAPRAQLKWPNDLLIAGLKCAGILVETTALSSGAFACAMGFGVNVAAVPNLSGRSVTSLAAHGIKTTAETLRRSLDEALRKGFAEFARPDGFESIRQRWLDHTKPIGTPITVTSGSGDVSGLFAGLDEDGALMIEVGTGNLIRLTYGDVSAAGTVV